MVDARPWRFLRIASRLRRSRAVGQGLWVRGCGSGLWVRGCGSGAVRTARRQSSMISTAMRAMVLRMRSGRPQFENRAPAGQSEGFEHAGRALTEDGPPVPARRPGRSWNQRSSQAADLRCSSSALAIPVRPPSDRRPAIGHAGDGSAFWPFLSGNSRRHECWRVGGGRFFRSPSRKARPRSVQIGAGPQDRTDRGGRLRKPRRAR